jgi:hypothetical protein
VGVQLGRRRDACERLRLGKADVSFLARDITACVPATVEKTVCDAPFSFCFFVKQRHSNAERTGTDRSERSTSLFHMALDRQLGAPGRR